MRYTRLFPADMSLDSIKDSTINADPLGGAVADLDLDLQHRCDLEPEVTESECPTPPVRTDSLVANGDNTTDATPLRTLVPYSVTPEVNSSNISHEDCSKSEPSPNPVLGDSYKLVVTYHFDFDLDNDVLSDSLSQRSSVERVMPLGDCGIAEDSFVNSDLDHDYSDIDSEYEYDSETEGLGVYREDSASKNNLLDGSLLDDDADAAVGGECDTGIGVDSEDGSFASTYESELENILESMDNVHVRLDCDVVQCDGAGTPCDDDKSVSSELEHSYASLLAVEHAPVECDDNFTNTIPDSHDENSANMTAANMTVSSRFSGNHSMRKGFIYYSSHARLYQGELCYSERDLSVVDHRRLPLVKRVLRKVFPSRKYSFRR